MVIPCGSFVILHEVHVESIFVEFSIIIILEGRIQLSLFPLIFFIFILVLFSIRLQIVTIVIIEGVIVFNLLQCLLDSTLLEHLPKLFPSLLLLHLDSHLFLFFILSLQFVVPMLLAILI